jgi:hypothetical protein
MQPSELAKKFNFVKVGEDGIPEFYCDHSLLSSLRVCESYFMLSHIENRRFVSRNWNLEFGQWLHSTLEVFYWHEYNKLHKINNPDFKTKNDDPEDYKSISKGKFLACGLQLWDDMKMEEFKGKHKAFETLKGVIGAAKLLSDYWTVYGDGKERLRVVGIELPFGRDKEVPIVDTHISATEFGDNYSWYSGIYRAFLTGRIDLMVDDLISIMPFDHKSTAFFDGSESVKFTPHDGMMGYAYAADKLVRRLFSNKRVSKVLVNHIALNDNSSKVDKEASSGKAKDFRVYDFEPSRRFTRTPISYTPEQLEEYRLRQAASFDVLYQLLVLERPPQWNTGSCNNMYYRECPFKALHAQTPKQREDTLRNMYRLVEQWNPFYESKAEVQ